jgi:hypothetical protein
MNLSILLLVAGLTFTTRVAHADELRNETANADLALDLALGQRASQMTRPLIEVLRLNEGEYIGLRRIHKVLLAAIDDINAQYSAQSAVHRAKLEELQSYYEQERVRVLTPKQVGQLNQHGTDKHIPTINTESGGLG